MVDEGSDSAAVLVGMPEFVVRAAVGEDGEVWVLIETPPAETGLSGVRNPGPVEGPPAHEGAGSRLRRSARRAGLGQAAVASPRPRLRRGDVDGAVEAIASRPC